MVLSQSDLEVNLKPCPFCRGTNIKLFIFDHGFFDYVICEDCHITIEYKHDVKIDCDKINTRKNVLANKWNIRNYEENVNEKNN